MIRINFLDVIDNSIVDILDNTKPYIVQALSNSLYDMELSKDEIQMYIEDQIFGMVNEIKEYEPDYIKCPTLIIGGRLDNFAPEQMSEELHDKIPHSRLKIIDFAGHFGPSQRFEKYNKIILEFIKNIQ
jgi:pimeloyl-ACP methyl ester carboxylesterase